MANTVFNQYKANLVTGSASIANAATDIYVALVNGYTVDETHTWASISSAQVTGVGYVSGGKLLSNVTVTTTTSAGDANDFVKVDADDVTWTTSTITATGAIVYKGTSLNNPTTVITYLDFGGSKSSSSGDFAILWNSSGILNYRQGT